MSSLLIGNDSEKFVKNVRIRIKCQLKTLVEKWQWLAEQGEPIVAPTEQAVNDALQLARIVFQQTKFIPNVHLGSDGEITFLWDVNRVRIHLGFYGDGTYSYFSDIDEDFEVSGDDVPVDTIPDELVDSFNQF